MITDLQKASFLKRMAAALLDLILLAVLITGIATLLAGTMGYADQVNAITESQKNMRPNMASSSASRRNSLMP